MADDPEDYRPSGDDSREEGRFQRQRPPNYRLRQPANHGPPSNRAHAAPRAPGNIDSCARCGAALPASVRFCGSCGAPRVELRGGQPPAGWVQQPPQAYGPPPGGWQQPPRGADFPPQNGRPQYSGVSSPPSGHKLTMSDLPWPVRIIVAIVAFFLISWFLSTQVFHTKSNVPKGEPCVMLFDTQTGQQLNPDCKPQ